MDRLWRSDKVKSITLRSGAEVTVSDADFPSICEFAWMEKKRSDGLSSYAFRWITVAPKRHKRRLMHHQILGLEGKVRVDHRDGNGLNNQRENLRPATQRQNAQNMRVLRIKDRPRPKASRFKGVSYSLVHKRDTLTKPWRSRIRVDGVLKNLGWFATQEEAAMAYNDAANRYFGEFAQINNLENK